MFMLTCQKDKRSKDYFALLPKLAEFVLLKGQFFLHDQCLFTTQSFGTSGYQRAHVLAWQPPSFSRLSPGCQIIFLFSWYFRRLFTTGRYMAKGQSRDIARILRPWEHETNSQMVAKLRTKSHSE